MNIARPAPRYTPEELQETYELSIPQAAQIIDKFDGVKRRIDRFMRRCVRRQA